MSHCEVQTCYTDDSSNKNYTSSIDDKFANRNLFIQVESEREKILFKEFFCHDFLLKADKNNMKLYRVNTRHYANKKKGQNVLFPSSEAGRFMSSISSKLLNFSHFILNSTIKFNVLWTSKLFCTSTTSRSTFSSGQTNGNHQLTHARTLLPVVAPC